MRSELVEWQVVKDSLKSNAVQMGRNKIRKTENSERKFAKAVCGVLATIGIEERLIAKGMDGQMQKNELMKPLGKLEGK